MKKGLLLVCGAYFSDERIKFFDNDLHDPSRFRVIDVNWEDVLRSRKVAFPEADFVFVFGLKRITRKLRKSRNKPPKIKALIKEFFTKNISRTVPLGVLDDLNLGDELSFGDFLRSLFLNDFNCKAFLLREYLSTKKYNKKVEPFSIPCVDYSNMAVPVKSKETDIYFKGNNSSKERKPVIDAVSKMGFNSSLLLYKGGERSGKKDKFETYLSNMAKSKVCLTFDGAGYCCFRYQEIPSVGSIIAVPKYPFVVRNDYIDMKSCIRFDSVDDLRIKLQRVLSSSDLLEQITAESLNNFRKYHTNVARYKMFLDAVDKL
jgi:hypothetical protein